MSEAIVMGGEEESKEETIKATRAIRLVPAQLFICTNPKVTRFSSCPPLTFIYGTLPVWLFFFLPVPFLLSLPIRPSCLPAISRNLGLLTCGHHTKTPIL